MAAHPGMFAAKPPLPVQVPSDGTCVALEGGRRLATASAKFCPRSSFIQFPTTEAHPRYLEITILKQGSGAGSIPPCVAVGVAWGEVSSHDPACLPGWEPALLGFHSDDGKVYEGKGESTLVVASPWHAQGQVAGVGVLPPSFGKPKHRLVFTLNGAIVNERPLAEAFDASKMAFALGLHGTNQEIRINTGQELFLCEAANNLPGANKSIFRPDKPAVLPAPAPVHDRRGSERDEVEALSRELASLRRQMSVLETSARPLDRSTYFSMRDDEVDSAITSVREALAGLLAEKERRAIAPVAMLHTNAGLCAEARKHGVQIMKRAWEDTARTKGSCFGPNISDMTLHAAGSDMPIIRMPNFADITSDHDIDMFYVVVGNERARAVKKSITLREYLMDVGEYTSNPRIPSLYWASRDSKVLVSSQACLLPVRDGKVEFNVRLYNYQSTSEPAVLVIVASSEGTSAQVVMGRDNTLRFNNAGCAADFVAERLSDDRAKRGVTTRGAMTEEEQQRNVLLIIQVPLQVSMPKRAGFAAFGAATSFLGVAKAATGGFGGMSMAMRGAGAFQAPPAARGIEAAMLSTSEARGVFEGTKGLKMERDPTMPIRVTLQHYHCTDTADIPPSAMAAIAKQVTELYDASAPWNRGSHVVGGGGAARVTAFGGADVSAPPKWHWGFREPPVTESDKRDEVAARRFHLASTAR